MSESHIRIKNEYFRNPEYIKFDKSVQSTVYRFLQAAIVRESKEVKNYTYGAKYIYNEHFLKGRLVCRYGQKKMAKYLQTSQGRVNSYLHELEKYGFIKIIKTESPFGELCFYQLGTWGGDLGKKTYYEIIWLDDIFSESILKNKNTKEDDYDYAADKKRLDAKFEGVYDEFDFPE